MRGRSPHRPAVWLAAAALACGAGGDAAPPAQSAAPAAEAEPLEGLSPSARPEIHEELLADLAAQRHPADGGGRAFFDRDPERGLRTAPAGGYGRFPIVYEAGPLSVAEGGWVFLQTPPYWGWSTPQVVEPRAPGFTRVTSDASGVTLTPVTLAESLLGIEIGGRALAAGETIRIDYGAGELGARVDRYAERATLFQLSVDGDGDGVRGLVPEGLAVDVAAGPAAGLVLSLPGVVRVGEAAPVRAAVLDAAGSRGPSWVGAIELALPEGVAGPEALRLEAGDGAVASAELVASAPGVVRVVGRTPEGFVAESNPMLVSDAAPRVLWADLHGHTSFSDGTGLPDDYFAYARDVAGLDAVALTDHDHWGTPFLDASPGLWQRIRDAVARHHEPGRFVALLGYEWTSWLHGHRHVIWFSEEGGRILSSVDEATDDPAELWSALRGQPVLTFAHHSAGGPVATNWDFAPDPDLEPVTEVASVHGSSEAPDAPHAIYAPVAGNFVRDALGRGYRLGFIGSGDSHDGHPGLAQLASPSAGLAAILSEERTREGIRAALRARRAFATNGPRILLQAALDERPMGAAVPAGNHVLFVRAIAVAPLERVDVVRGPETVLRVAAEDDARELVFELPLEGLRAGEWVYVRVVQRDGGAAWSSPFYVGD